MEQVGANIFVETVYPGVNVGCLITDRGSLCVDTPLLPGEAQRWRTRINSLQGEPVRYVVYSSGQRERALGTQYLISARPTGTFSARTQSWPAGDGPRHERAVLAHEMAWDQIMELDDDGFKQSMVDTFAERDPDILNLEVVPPHIALDESLKLYLGEEQVELIAAAPGMLWVWLPRHKVLFTGDIVVVGTHPMLTITDTREWLSALARLRRERRFQDAVFVPGQGALCDTAATEAMTAYLRAARDRTRRIYRAGRSKTNLNKVAADLLPLYPVADGQLERVQRQIKQGLDALYDQFKTDDAAVG